MTTSPAGWYPAENNTERYWDGAAWTSQTRPAGPPAPLQAQIYQQQSPLKKKHTVRNIFLAAILVMILCVGGCIALVGGAVNQVSKDASKSHEVTYIVGGTAKKADLTFTTDGSTSMSQLQGQSVPWRKQLHIAGSILSVYQLMAQNDGNGTITCEILVDGKSVRKATSQGLGAIASCDYSN